MNSKDKMIKSPNCYDCIHRGDLVGDAHSCCNHPKIKAGPRAAVLALAGMFGLNGYLNNELGVAGSSYGIKHGWFCWPMNFDPVWLESCNGFEGKGGEISDQLFTCDCINRTPTYPTCREHPHLPECPLFKVAGLWRLLKAHHEIGIGQGEAYTESRLAADTEKALEGIPNV